MRRGDFKQPIVPLMIFLVPLVMMKGAALFGDVAGPRAARAASADKHASKVSIAMQPAAKPSPAVVRAADYAARLRRQSWGLSPFPMPKLPTGTAPAPQVIPLAEPGEVALTVQSIMASPRGAFAVVDGAVRGVGDSLAETDWLVQAIDVHSRLVTFHNRVTGESVTVGVNGDERH